MIKYKNNFTLIFLHGFLGDSTDWDFIKEYNDILLNYNCLAIDLPGHGKFLPHENLPEYSEDFVIKTIDDIIKKHESDKIILIGYSLGARAALSYACQYPTALKGLVLESGTAGITDLIERKDRQAKDYSLYLELTDNFDKFINNWYNSPIFGSLSQKSIIKDFLIQKRKNNNPKEAGKLLIGFSQGIMKPKWDYLKSLSIPTLLITGELDKKYTEINKKMNMLLPSGNHYIIKNAGHIPHFENKQDFIKTLVYYLETL
jgi:2-succinyl-6-hydroxy-2,4-cyclohexadiene-1-carboxylate synthase